MSLQFVFGPSGAGKSTTVFRQILSEAAENRKKNYLVIVPDQFTMQTQKDLVTLSENDGILNVDVLSFGRLHHRILEEVGGEDIPVLDDTGKSLVLQKVAANLREELPTLGSFLHKQGYIHEVKSAISEFMQYGIGVGDVTKLIDYAGKRGALVQKLKDLQTIYQGFLSYIDGHFITTEETLDVLCRHLHHSAILPGSVVVFDGFTGFTPIQYRVILELMKLCEKVIVTVTMGAQEDPFVPDGEQRLFHLSKKTVADLEKLAVQAQIDRTQDIYVRQREERKDSALAHLERSLFRFRVEPYTAEQTQIHLFQTTNPKSEVRQTGLKIRELIREQGIAYRDIAVVIGNLEEYAPYIETEFEQMDIPVYLDCTRGITLNPMVEYIKSALELFLQDFSYEAVFHYLRSGLADMEPEEADLLENYVIRTGVRGYRKYSRMFTRKTTEASEAETRELATVNALRERLLSQVGMLRPQPEEPVRDYVEKLYEFLVTNRVQQKLAVWEETFAADGDKIREREYAQIYRLVMELLEQIYGLLGDEKISLQEFADILEAGFGEISVGTIPQNVDRVVVGDMERSRLTKVRVLFFLGVNDGNIPGKVSKGGIISDVDREFLRESGLELAPSPRQQMFIQRLYLYLNMTKPTERLYLSYSRVDSLGQSMRPAYLIDTMKKLFPGLCVEYPEARSTLEQIVTGREGEAYLAEGLREYVAGILPKEREREIFTIYHIFGQEEWKEKQSFLEKAAFYRYQESGLSRAVARALYGTTLENSVTRLETFASCAYQHFLRYGLALQERGEFTFERVDLGTVYHEVLERFAAKLEEDRLTWFDFTAEYAGAAVEAALKECAASYRDTILYSSARNEYALVRMTRILSRTVLTIQSQLKKGSFLPEAYEISFRFADDLGSVNLALSEDEKIRLRGRIDRVDTLVEDDRVYVKVVDYKSGSQAFDLAAVYHGLQLQLVVYMNAAMEIEAKKHPDKEILPAALLYYRISDPAIESEEELTPEELNALISRQLRMDGVVSSEEGVAKKLDSVFTKASDVIPVELKKDGTFAARSSLLSGEEFRTVSRHVTEKILSIGKEILGGKIALNPYEFQSGDACGRCAFRAVCGFETSVPGCEKRRLESPDKQEILSLMREEENKGKEGETDGSEVYAGPAEGH